MPRPNRPDEFQQINFLVNYFIQGCSPPASLFLEFAKEPAFELAALILFPTAEDVGTAVLDQPKGRRRKPGRHGRKRRLRVGLPDTSDLIAQRLDRARVITNFIRLSPLRYLLPLWNLWEGVNITVALVEGFTGTFYEGVLGVVTVSEDECTNLDFLRRSRPGMQTLGGPGVLQQPFQLTTVDRVFGFVTQPTGALNADRDSRITVTTTIRPTAASSTNSCYVSLKNQNTGQEVFSPIRRAADTGWKTRSVSMAVPKGDTVTWGISNWSGFWEVINTEAIGYSTFNFPWDD